MPVALYITVFLIATCGLVYELVSAAAASYLLGDTVLHFSTVIGTYLFSMGIGSYLSRFIKSDLCGRFVRVELLVGAIGGFSAPLFFLAFAYSGAVRPVLYPTVGVIGMLVGLEIPLLMRILKEQVEFEDLVAYVLTWDYVGALAASLMFPLVLIPTLGLVRASLFFGLINVLVGLWTIRIFRDFLLDRKMLMAQGVILLGGLLAAILFAHRLVDFVEERVFGDPVVIATSSPYQRIAVTHDGKVVRFFLNNHLQFSSDDEHRYHESLVHPGLAACPNARTALVLGGGDGMAVREILRYPGIESVTLVELDANVSRLFQDHEMLKKLNGGALRSPRVRVVNADAFVWLGETKETFDFIVADFPDPGTYSIGKLYTTLFYRMMGARLNPNGAAVIQATSPYHAPKSFWCVVETVRAAGLNPTPYHAYVPSMGDWGFVLARKTPADPPGPLPTGLRFLDERVLRSLFEFPPDQKPVPVQPNRLDNQILVRYYISEWE